MVITVGCYYETGYFEWYDSETNRSNCFEISIDEITNAKLFQEVKKNIKHSIDYFCVYLPNHWKNSVRKEFLEYANTQKDVKNIRTVGFYQALLCNVIKEFSVSPLLENSIWIFVNDFNSIDCATWSYNVTNGWEFEKYSKQPKMLQGRDKSPTLDEISGLKNKLSDYFKNPYIWVYSISPINEKEFKSVFSNYKRIFFTNKLDPSRAALNYARCLSNENRYSKYRSMPFLEKNYEIKHNGENVLNTGHFISIPYTQMINLTVNDSDIITILEDGIITETIYAKGEQKFNLTFTADINGIYTLYAKNIVVLENLQPENDYYYYIPQKSLEYNPNLNSVGIDFGTTECCAAVIRKNAPDFVVLDDLTGLRTMPSYVAFDEENPKFGQIVINRMWYKFQHSVFDIKRILGKEFDQISVDPLWPFTITKTGESVSVEVHTCTENETKSAEEISAVILKHIKKQIEKYQNLKLTHAIITIPSQFTDKQKHSLKTAAELAGWLNITFLPEPIAAAFAYFSEIDIPNNSNVFICDIGGGTVDICIAKICENKLKILNFDGDSYLGGRDFDYILYTHFKGILQHKFGFDITKSLKKYDLKQKCQEIKHTLSVTEEYWINVDEFVFNVDERIKITKTEFEEMSLPLILKIKNVILRVLENGNILRNEINFVFQVGGGCRMPLIKQLLKDIFPDSNHQCSLYPDWVVAHGAALYAYSLQTNIRGKIYENLHSESEVYTIPKQPSSYNPELNAVGIDFGTTECSAAVIRKNGPDLIVLDSVTIFRRTMPSYVAFDEENPKCGQIVVDRMRSKSEYSVFDIKRIMGKNIDEIIIDPLWPFKVIKGKESVFIEVETFAAKETKSGEEISSVLLNHIKKQIEEYQASNLTDAVITVPSKFTDKQKHSLKTAAELAGLSNVIFLPEPIPAAFAYFTELNILNNSNIFICDFGGGTVDICVAKVINDELKILNSDGDSYLGGRDFDNVLFTYFNGILKHKFNFDVTKDSKKYVLKQKCQGIKHALSKDEADWMYVDDFDRTVDETIRITRIEFEEMSLPLVLKVKSVIFRALKNSNLAKNDINYVFQVGGGCRMPMIKKLLVEVFPDSIHHCSLNPDWAVAHGAALYSYNLKTNKEGNETTVIDPNQAPSWLTKYFEVL